jgi:ribbon-helix-helix CopG family protein
MSQYPQINVRVDKEFLERLDEWRRKQPDLPTRPEALRRLAEQALAAATKHRRAK